MIDSERKLLLLLANMKRSELVYNKETLEASKIDTTLLTNAISMIDNLIGNIIAGDITDEATK